MAALIKSSNIATAASLLLDPTAPRTETHSGTNGKSAVAIMPAPVTAVEPVIAIQTTAVLKEPASPDMDTEAEAYARFMAKHEVELQSLEKKVRQEAYAAAFAEGEKAGYVAGLEKGESESAEKYSQALSKLEHVVTVGNQAISGSLADAESLIGAIVFQSVCKIVGDTLNTPEGVLAVVQRALSDAKRDEIVALKVSPEDMRLLLDHESSLQPGFARLQSFGLVADERVALGGCIVQLKGGHIDARIETQFRSFAQSLKEAIQDRR